MTTTVLCVLGDRFEPFAAGQETVRTVSALVREFRAGHHRPEQPVGTTLILTEGQGVSGYDWERIRDELDRCGLTPHVVIVPAELGPVSRQSETHKHRQENVLVAGLVQVDETRFRAELRLHNDQELLLDHQGGHVQGMVVVEAARQAFLAVSERYFATAWPEHRYSYVMDSMDCRFHAFLYPLATTIEYEVIRAAVDDQERLDFEVRIEFEQAGLPVATVHMTCGAIHESVMARKERLGATRALRVLRRKPAVPPPTAR